MTDPQLPKFPSTPEEIKAASEKAMNFWVGALSPMWVPFWAASSFGLGAWAVSQGMSKKLGEGLLDSDTLMKDIPTFGAMAAKWPGFSGVWTGLGATSEPEVETKKHAPVPMPEMLSGVTVAAMAAAMQSEVAEAPAKAEPEKALPATIPVEKPKAVKSKVVKPPLTKAAAPKPVAPKPVEVEAVPVKIEPRPIAKAMSAVKSPKTKA